MSRWLCSSIWVLWWFCCGAMRAGQPSSRPAHMRHWWNGIVIQSQVDSGVKSTKSATLGHSTWTTTVQVLNLLYSTYWYFGLPDDVVSVFTGRSHLKFRVASCFIADGPPKWETCAFIFIGKIYSTRANDIKQKPKVSGCCFASDKLDKHTKIRKY